MHGTALVPGGWRHLLARLPEAECPIAGRQLSGDGEAARLKVDQQLAPALRALPHAVLETEELLLALGVAPISTSMHSAWGSMRACR